LHQNGYKVILCAATEGVQEINVAGLEHACAVLVRQNSGFDFAQWAATLTALPELFNAQSLLFTNDSVIGPLGDYPSLIQRIRESKHDFLALSDSYQIKYHTQSYFFVLNASALQHPRVQAFWRTINALKHKEDVILHY